MLDFLPKELSPDQASQLTDLTRKGQIIDMDNLPDELNPDQADQLLKQVGIFGMTQKRATQGTTGATGNYGTPGGPQDLPIEGRISQGYGVPVNYEKSGKHGGIDIAVAEGTPIPDRHGGEVVGVENSSGGYGISVLVKGGDGVTRRYSHLSAPSVRVGQPVKPNEVIGLSGNTGNSTGPHLDYREYR